MVIQFYSLFKHLKSTFDETKHTLRRELTAGDSEDESHDDEDVDTE